MSSLLGGNSSGKNSSSSTTGIYNQAYSGLANALGSQVTNGTSASSLLSGLLTGTGSTAGYDAYQDSSGFANQLATGTKAITNNAATSGLLNSGATLKALDTYGTGLADQNYNNYLSQLSGLVSSGNSAASTIAGAGGVTNTTSTSNGKTSSKTGLGI